MYVIGTAGHVDHGKTSLVQQLTGINTDRLAEEQRRGMTIELGFAWMQLPSGRDISLVDVPGHERFIKHMLAGVGGFDAAMLVIAADESVMPQTREHVAIIDLLDIRHGIIVVTKADLVEPAWLPLVCDDIRAQLQGTTLAHAPMVVVSARTGYGMPALVQALDTLIDALPTPQRRDEPARLWVDRVFSVDGFGAVVTGTLLAAPFQVGMEVEIAPRGIHARIRGLQMHRRKIDVAQPGTRIAVNLAGISHHDIARGDLVTLHRCAVACDADCPPSCQPRHASRRICGCRRNSGTGDHSRC
jgi:selenocysteine-specific elongation factor